MSDFKFKYNEDTILAEMLEYIKTTYGEHYSRENGIQLFDHWEARGTLQTMGVGTAEKYLARFGEKEGFNRKDLKKALHYVVLAMYALDKSVGKDKVESTPTEMEQQALIRNQHRWFGNSEPTPVKSSSDKYPKYDPSYGFKKVALSEVHTGPAHLRSFRTVPQ